MNKAVRRVFPSLICAVRIPLAPERPLFFEGELCGEGEVMQSRHLENPNLPR